MTACATGKNWERDFLAERMAQWRVAQTRDSVVTELRDTLREVTRVMVQLDEAGDTLRMSTVTDIVRARAVERRLLSDARETIRVDTVYVAVREPLTAGSHRGGLTAGLTRPHRGLAPRPFQIVLCMTAFGLLFVIVKFKIRRTRKWQK